METLLCGESTLRCTRGERKSQENHVVQMVGGVLYSVVFHRTCGTNKILDERKKARRYQQQKSAAGIVPYLYNMSARKGKAPDEFGLQWSGRTARLPKMYPV